MFDLKSRIKIKDDGASQVLKRITETTKMAEKAAGVYRDSMGRLRDTHGRYVGTGKQVEAQNKRIAQSFGSLGRIGRSALSGIGGVARGAIGPLTSLKTAIFASSAAYAGIYKPLELASDAEQANIAFETMLGSAKKAQTLLSDLTSFANKTPFELPELRDSSKRLLAFGFASEQIIPMMTGVGNAAAGLGLGGDGIDRLTLALGQMKAKARVSGDEMLQLTEAGIPAWDILAKKMRISTREVMKLAEKGVIPADAAINALIDGMNSRFPNMMDKQSKTMRGLYSTIKDTFSNKILKEWGTGIATAIQPRLMKVVEWIDRNEATIKRWGETLKRAATVAFDWVLNKVERTFSYLNRNYFNNPDFMKLPFDEKVRTVLTDAGNELRKWFDGGGKTLIQDGASKLVGLFADSLKATQPLLEAAGLIGGEIAKGIWDGMQKVIAENPAMTTILGAIAGSRVGGLYGAAVGAGAALMTTIDARANVQEREYKAARDGLDPSLMAYASAAYTKWATNSGIDWAAMSKKSPLQYVQASNGFYEDVAKKTGLKTNVVMDMARTRDPKVYAEYIGLLKANGYASGLDRVPYNRFPARLHKDEMVLTKTEASDYREGQRGRNAGTRPFTINIGTMNVRNDGDIDAIAWKLAYHLAG